jgi:hypothetical protein
MASKLFALFRVAGAASFRAWIIERGAYFA